MHGEIYSLSPAGHETMTRHEYSNLVYYYIHYTRTIICRVVGIGTNAQLRVYRVSCRVQNNLYVYYLDVTSGSGTSKYRI